MKRIVPFLIIVAIKKASVESIPLLLYIFKKSLKFIGPISLRI